MLERQISNCVPSNIPYSYWVIFEVQNFRGLVTLKFFANKFSRMAASRQEMVTCMYFNFRGLRLQDKSAKAANL